MSSKHAVAYRQDNAEPWIGLPGVATDGDIDQMFALAGLADWDVRKRLIETDARTESDDFEVIRTNPNDGLLDRLATSKARYETYQNETALDFARNLTHGDIVPNAMGALDHGRKVFMSFQMGDSVTIEGTDDKIKHFLHVLTSHDGSWAFGAYTGNMRMACQNMIRSLRSNALSSFKARHTETIGGRIADARTALGIAVRQNEAFEKDMAALVEVEVTKQKFWALVEDIFPKPEKDVRGSVKKWETKTDTIMGIWNGDTLAGLEDNAYKAYNALNENLLWYSAVRAGNVENALVRASGFDDASNKTDVALYRKVLALA